MPSSGPIAYVAKMFPRISETFITNEIKELRRHGHELHLVSLMRPTAAALWPEVEALAVGTTYLPDPSTREASSALLRDHLWVLRRRPLPYFRALLRVTARFSAPSWKRFRQAGALSRLCLERGVSHVHAGFAHTPASVAYWTKAITGISYSFTAHAKDLYLSEPRSIRNKMDAATFVWTCTHANAAYLRGLGSPTPVQVGYHGIDLTAFRNDGLAPADSAGGVTNARTGRTSADFGMPRNDGLCARNDALADDMPGSALARQQAKRRSLLTVSRLVPKKGLPYLVDAFAQLVQEGRDLEWIVAGDGPERKGLEARIEALGLQDRVRFLGSLLPEQVRSIYTVADLFVLPSIVLDNGDRDGVPNVLVEAMAMGLPVISTRTSAIPELIRDGRTGRLAAPGSAKDLARVIACALDDVEGTRSMAGEAKRFVAEQFDLRSNSAALADRLRDPRQIGRAVYVNADLGIPVRGHKGASAHVRQIAGRLAEQGIDVQVIAADAGPLPPEGNGFDLPIREVPPSTFWTRRLRSLPKESGDYQRAKETRRLFHNFAVAKALLERRVRPDFVYERYALCAIATGIICRMQGLPWLVEVNAPLAEEEARFRGLLFRRLTLALERWVLRNADHVFVVSHALRRWAMECGVHPDRVELMPNAVDSRLFHPEVDGTAARASWGTEPGEVVVLFSGSLKPWHGVHVLVDAVVSLQERGVPVRLVLVGDGPEQKALQKRIKKESLGARVVLTGAVPQHEVPAMLAGADILAAPYLPQEDFYFSPLKMMEYFAVGKPVVASRIGDLQDWVDPSCGRLVPPGDRVALAQAIEELARSGELRDRLGAVAAGRVRGHDWSDRAGRVLEVARTLRAEPRRRGRFAPAGSERLRVGYVLKMFPRFSETFILREILELEKQDVDVRVFSMKTPTGPLQQGVERVRARRSVLPLPAQLFEQDVLAAHLRCMGRSPSGYFRALRFAVTRRDVKALHKFLQAGLVADASAREGIQHLHAHFASGPARVAKLSSMISGVPFSFTAHAKDLYWDGHNHQDSKKLKKRVQLARFVVVISEENKRFLSGLGFKIKEGKVRPVYIGLDSTEYAYQAPSARPRSRRPLVLAVGRLIEKKGFHVLIDALAELSARGQKFRCLIAGEGPEEEALRQRIAARGLSGSVRLLGPVPLARLRQRYYSRARVLAQPCVVAADGDRDGIPTVILEAMALGVPVVSTAVSGIPEAIEDGIDGFLTEAGDVAGLALRMQQLLTDAELADSIAAAARVRVEQQFELGRNAGALRKLYLRSAQGWKGLGSGATADATQETSSAELMATENDRRATPDRGLESPLPGNFVRPALVEGAEQPVAVPSLGGAGRTR